MEEITSAIKIKEIINRYGNAVNIGDNCDFSHDLTLELSDDDSFLKIGDNVSIRRGVTIQVSRGATLVIGNNVAIGENVFISAMVGIYIGDGCGISNMVDIHDHNHRVRSDNNLQSEKLNTFASGFEGAPIVVNHCAIISNKVTLTAGCTVGQNSIIGANSVVTGAIPPNVVAAGSPAIVIRSFNGRIVAELMHPIIRTNYFGTSIMEHLEAYSENMFQQWNLPKIGSQITVESWRQRGYVHNISMTLRSKWPWVKFDSNNFGEGGANSRDIYNTIVNETIRIENKDDLSFYGCGINDVWRKFQNRINEHVDVVEFEKNYRDSLLLLKEKHRLVVCVLETPFGSQIQNADEMNNVLFKYNEVAQKVASQLNIPHINPWDLFTTYGNNLDLWSDGVHLSEIGDAIMSRLIVEFIQSDKIIEKLLRPDLLERSLAVKYYSSIFKAYRIV